MDQKDITEAAALLSKLEPGFLPFAVFHEIVRLTATPIIELVPLRAGKNGGIEILLNQRPADDPIWPGQWHVAGTVIRATDTSYATALQRITETELQLHNAPAPVFVKNILHHSGRGTESSLIYWVGLAGGAAKGTFYNTDNLPSSLVQSQLDFIPDAIANFKQAKHL